MTTKINRIRSITPQTLQVDVDFIDGDEVVLQRSYNLAVTDSIETLYPQFKEDLNGLEKGKALVANLGGRLDEEIDLKDVKSISELKTEEEVKNTQEATTLPKSDATTPLG